MNSALKKFAIALAVGAVSIGTAAPAMAHPGWGDGYSRHYEPYRPGDYYEGERGYDRDVRYYRGYRGHHRHYDNRCRDNGTGGAIIGAIAGGLIGNGVAGRGNKTSGTVVGGAIGAVAGHLIDKSDGRPC